MSKILNKIPEAVWCQYCGAGSRMAFIPDPYRFHCPYCGKYNILENPLYIKLPLEPIPSGRIKTGVSQVGGKFRLLTKIKDLIPYHEFFLSMFSGACWVECNKPRTRYECFNDLDSEFINYLVTIREYPKQFDELKRGVYGLVSQEICNRIVRGEIRAKNNIARAYNFYYLNKLTFGGDVKKVGKKEEDEEHAHQCGIMRPTDPCRQPQVEKIKKEYQTKGYCGLNQNRAIPQTTFHEKDIEKIKKDYEWKTKGYHGLVDQKLQNARIDSKGVEEAKKNYKKVTIPMLSGGIGGRDGAGNDDNIKKAKASFAGINNTRAGNNASNMRDMDKWKKEFKDTVDEGRKEASYKGIANHGATGWGTLESGEVKKAKAQYQAVSYKGINPKTTRPYHNNDCGLLTPLDQKAIERLRYVNLTCYDFRKVYKLFYNAFHKRKGLSRECFVYADPPYPTTEKYYGDKFKTEYHQELIDLMLETPFNFMLSIGGKCEMYLEQLSDWVIVPVKVRYSTDATSQKKSQEYIVMNYEINDIGNMKQDNQASIMRFMK